MKEISIKSNLIYNSIRIVIKMFFPIIILPIITKKMGPERFGLIEYALSIVSYFMLFSSLGIHNYGAREVSISRGSKVKLSKLVLELYYLLLIISSISLLVYLCLIFFINEFRSHILLYLIFGLQVLFTITSSGEWIYEGLEDQRFITYRTFFVQLLFIFLVYWIINSSNDYLLYALLLSLVNPASTLINIFFLRRSIKVKRFKIHFLSIFKHLKYVLITFGAQISTLIYTQSGITIIGAFSTMTAVGYYSVAVKFFRLSTILWAAFSGTLIPRLTYYWSNKKVESYQKLGNNILSLLILVAVFINLIIFSLSDSIITIFAGSEYIDSILTLKILSFGILGSAFSYFFGIIILYSQKQESKFLQATFSVAILNVILNLVVISLSSYNAVAIVSVLSEYFCFTYLTLRFRSNYKMLEIITGNNIKSLFAGFLSGIVLYNLLQYITNPFLQVATGVIVGGFLYILLLFLFKHSYLKGLISQIGFKWNE